MFFFCNTFDRKKKKKYFLFLDLFAKCLLFPYLVNVYFSSVMQLMETNEILHLFEFLFSVELCSYTSAEYCFDILNVDLYALPL